MAYNFSTFKVKGKEIEEWLKKELGAIHTGRASIALLDGVRAEVYGNFMPLQQVANLTVEDARTIRIVPWDKGAMGAIDSALREANLGLSIFADDKGIRAIFPELTGESREKYAKLVGKKLEEARISVRNAREEIWSDIQAQEKDGKLSEDEKFRGKEDMEKIVKETNEALEVIAKRKEDEIRG